MKMKVQDLRAFPLVLLDSWKCCHAGGAAWKMSESGLILSGPWMSGTYEKEAPPHLVTTGGQALSKGLDRADFVILDQLRQTAVWLTVSRYDELSFLILGDDKMTAPVVAPLEEKEGRWDESEAEKKQLNSVQQIEWPYL